MNLAVHYLLFGLPEGPAHRHLCEQSLDPSIKVSAQQVKEFRKKLEHEAGPELAERAHRAFGNRDAQRWIRHHGMNTQLAASLAADDINRRSRREYVPCGDWHARRAHRASLAAAEALGKACVFHGTDRVGRPIHYEVLGNLDIARIRGEHHLQALLWYKEFETTFYQHSVMDWCWMDHLVRVVAKQRPDLAECLLRAAFAAEQEEEEEREEREDDDDGGQQVPGSSAFITSSSNRIKKRKKALLKACAKVLDEAAALRKALPKKALRGLDPGRLQRPRQILSVVDMKNTNSSHLSKFVQDFCRAMGEIGNRRCPDTAVSIVVINSPWALRALWSSVKFMVNEQVASTVKLVGGDGSDILHTMCDADQLPRALGGTCRRCPAGEDGGCFSARSYYGRRKFAWLRGEHAQAGGMASELKRRLLEICTTSRE